jgi:hypothetical protein
LSLVDWEELPRQPAVGRNSLGLEVVAKAPIVQRLLIREIDAPAPDFADLEGVQE